jgi:hypothetical protein
MANDFGCPYVVSRHKRGRDIVFEYCHKLPEHGKLYCLKHQLIIDETPNEQARRREAQKKLKDYQKEQEAVLAASPLAAINPLFDEHEHARLKARQEAKQERRGRQSHLIAAR